MQKRLFIQYKQVFTILHLNIPSVRTLTLLQLLPRYCRVGKVIVPLIFETTGRNEFYFKQCWCIEAIQITSNSKRSFQRTFSAFQQAYNYNVILTVNRNVVCSLRNLRFSFLSCEIDSILLQWHRIRELIGSEPDSGHVCSSHRFYFMRRYAAE